MAYVFAPSARSAWNSSSVSSGVYAVEYAVVGLVMELWKRCVASHGSRVEIGARAGVGGHDSCSTLSNNVMIIVTCCDVVFVTAAAFTRCDSMASQYC